MFKDDSVRIRHIVDAAQEAVEFVEGRRREELDSNRMLNLSLVRLLEIIGEAARGISEEFRQEHAELPWKKMVGMRDRLIHGYYDINLDVVWETVQEDLPDLIVWLSGILDS
ncbi:MAG: DUF86 domain-containing protein [Sedimentisphaerales bacterium]|nr:DUF86 domain-containing protein [Sedimentisphaerales bacterium]